MPYEVRPFWDKQKEHYGDKLALFTFPSLDNTNLKGYFLQPDTPSSKLMVIGHGWTLDARASFSLAEKFKNKGFNVLMFDFRAHGASNGDFSSLGVHEGKDVIAAILKGNEKLDELINNNDLNSNKEIYYYGHSMGAASFLLSPLSTESIKKEASDRGSTFKSYQSDHSDKMKRALGLLNGAILDGGFAYIDFEREQTIQWLKWIPGLLSRMKRNFMAEIQPADKNLAFKDIKPAEIFNTYLSLSPPESIPKFLLIHGEKDDVTNKDHSDKLVDTLKTTPEIEMKQQILENYPHHSVYTDNEPFHQYRSILRGENNGEKLLKTVFRFINDNG